ncbi:MULTISPECIES: cupin domain-containing protein [unclassified Wenzhouxiangella]|uniref:cupin domain-containing protein n=1 Tax=unclassified Wenzhouxiangella TaxID=2613841 RepID=UPI000E32B9C5|nr:MULTISPECIES: cupin domain-containing protein [unclassified Wenzhouxiangella]RFF28220.1 cupin domain-containing protein [Wenzhouxiangella sp. 15181]RFP67895.1 cupin domain-containing protein [Wenzhouxiangella sp. 15190]
MTIRHAHDCPEYWFEEGCWITELSNTDDDPALSIARARVAPGGITRWHALDGITERYTIVSGRGRVELGNGVREAVAIGDVVIIPPGLAQRIENTGEDDLVFLALCTPRFRSACYRDLDEG